MVEVKNQKIIQFAITGEIETHAVDKLNTEHSSLTASSYALDFTNPDGQLIRKSRLKAELNNFKQFILAHEELTFQWIDTHSRENCCFLDFQTLVNDFFLAIFFLPHVKLNEKCYHNYGNQKIAKHVMQGEAELLSPEGIVKRHEIENCQANLLYHEDWDWMMSAWNKLRTIARNQGIMINKQIDDIFGVSIQIYTPDGTFIQFDDDQKQGLRSLWQTTIKYILWFENELKNNN